MSSAGAGGRRVTVRSISCRGVKAFVPFQKPPLYVAVSLAGRREKTNADPDGGENPDWDGAVFAFDLVDGGGAGEGGGMLLFEVKAQVPLLGNKVVGRVSVPRDDLAGGDGMAPRHVSYQVCAADGKANGKLSFTPPGGAASPQPKPQLHQATNGARPEQDPPSCCAALPPPPSGAPYPAAATLPPPHTPRRKVPPNSSYPPPPPTATPPTLYPPLPPSCTACPPAPPPSQYISSYPPPSNYYPPPPPPPPPAGYPPPTSTYPPPPEPGSHEYPPRPRSAACSDCSADRAPLPYMSPPLHDAAVTYPPLSAAPCYPPPATWQPGDAPYSSYYPQPGTRYL
uniref:C2 domain-containing protein n=1 Tax=Oryza brachyantha TaxID=4533 RepID=J3N8T7_ORYBR